MTPIFPSSLFSFPFQGPPGPYGNPGLPGPPGAKVSVCCGVWRESRGTDAEVRAALGELLFLEAPGGWASGSRTVEDIYPGLKHSLEPPRCQALYRAGDTVRS